MGKAADQRIALEGNGPEAAGKDAEDVDSGDERVVIQRPLKLHEWGEMR